MPKSPLDFNKRGSGGKIEDYLPEQNAQRIRQISDSVVGQSNTGSNQGTDGVGVYDAKVGVDLQFRHVAPASAKITVVLNGKDIDLDVVVGSTVNTVCVGNDSRLSDARTPTQHDNAYHSTNYAAEAITITAGTGLTGGGNLTENRTINCSITQYTDTLARTALGNIIGSDGHLDGDLDADGHGLVDCDRVHFRDNVNASIELEDHFTTDHRYHGITIDITCAVAFGLPVYISADNTVAQADADQITTMPCIGVSVGTNKVLIMGVIYDLTYSFANGEPVYVTSAGILDDAIPTGVGDIVQVVGVAIDTDTLLVNPSLDWVERV